MGIGRAWPSDAAEITRSVSRLRFGAAACRTGVSLALAKARGSGKLGPASVHLEGDSPKIRDAANRAQGSSGERALLGAACRGDAPQGALRISGCSPFHPNIDEDHFKRSRWSAGTGLTGEASIWFRAPVSLCETASQELTGLLHAEFMKFLSRYARTPRSNDCPSEDSKRISRAFRRRALQHRGKCIPGIRLPTGLMPSNGRTSGAVCIERSRTLLRAPGAERPQADST